MDASRRTNLAAAHRLAVAGKNRGNVRVAKHVDESVKSVASIMRYRAAAQNAKTQKRNSAEDRAEKLQKRIDLVVSEVGSDPLEGERRDDFDWDDGVSIASTYRARSHRPAVAAQTGTATTAQLQICADKIKQLQTTVKQDERGLEKLEAKMADSEAFMDQLAQAVAQNMEQLEARVEAISSQTQAAMDGLRAEGNGGAAQGSAALEVLVHDVAVQKDELAEQVPHTSCSSQ